jgi:hypothetical protein
MKKGTSFRLSEYGLELLERLATRYGLSQAGVLEMLIRDRAREEQLVDAQDRPAQTVPQPKE